MRPLRFARLAVELAILHFLLAVVFVVFGEGSSILAWISGLVGKILTLPVIVLWAILPEDGVSDVVQWAVLAGNSVLWGLAVAMLFRWAAGTDEARAA